MFHPYRCPSAGPRPFRARVNAATSSGSVAPIAVAGASRATNATLKRTALTSQAVSATGAVAATTARVSPGNASARITPDAATATSSAA